MTLVPSLLAIGLIVISSLSLLVIHRAWKTCDPTRQDKVTLILFAFVSGNAFFFMLIPSLLRLFLAWESDLAIRVDPVEIAEVYLIEFISILIWATSFRAIFGKRSESPALSPGRLQAVQRTFLGLLLICAIFINIDTYQHGSAIAEAGFVPGASTLLSDRLLWPISTICVNAGSIVGCYVLARGRRELGNVLWILGIAGVAVYAVAFGFRGVRGSLIWPALWTVLVLSIYRTRIWLLVAVPALIAVIIAVGFQDRYMALRDTQVDDSMSTRMEVLQKSESAKSSNLFSTVESRLGCASRYSVAFVRMWDTGRGAYWNPIVNSLYAPLPRLFFPDKPWPTSRDGNMYSAGMYIIMTELSQSENYSMTEFLTGPHAYWEFGWAGVLILSAVTAAYSRLALTVGRRLASAGPPVIVYFFRPWGYNNPRLWVSDAIIEVVQVIPAICLVWAVAYAWNMVWSYSVSTMQKRVV